MSAAKRAPDEADAAVARARALRGELVRRARVKECRLLRELSLRRHVRGAFAAFVRLMWEAVEPGTPLVWTWHLDVLCWELQQQMNGSEAHRRLLIMIPPGMMKSLLTSVFAPAWEWLFTPERRKLFLANDDDLVVRDSRRTREVMTSPEYQGLSDEASRRRGDPAWRLTHDQNEKTNFENTRRGFRQCRSIRSKITGKRADDINMDDLLDVKEVIMGSSETIARRCAEVGRIVDQVLPTRVNDLATARWTLIMQRLHVNDPAGRALAEGGWRVVCLPMAYDPEHEQAYEHDPRTEPGELLFPVKFPAKEVAILRKKLGLAQSAAQLDQTPGQTSGGRIRREWFRERYTCRPEDIAATADEVWVSADAAKKGRETNDFHAIHVWARKGAKRYVLGRATERMGYPEFEQCMDGLIERWKPFITRGGGVYIEDTANGSTYLQVRRPRFPFLVDFSPTRDTPGKDKSKGARAVYLERAAESQAIVLPDPSIAPWVEELLACWCAFPEGAHDDDVDAASQIVMRWAVADGAAGGSGLDFFGSLF